MGMVVREPVGIIAAITPFNFPLNLAMHKIGPALGSGNAVIHKPASATPVSALELARLFQEAGLPEGALSVLPGPGAELGEALARHPDVAMITFTGSPDVGVRLRQVAGLKRLTLELGSNSAVIVEPDADLAAAVQQCVAGAYAHSGQVCISVQRIFVHRDVFNEFAERFAENASRLQRGHPLDDSTVVSSLITEEEARRVEQWVEEAVQRGARLLAGGERNGTRMVPAVVLDVDRESNLFAKEAFGPVAAINSYEGLDDAIAMVNDSSFGLQAGIFTRDLARTFHAAREVAVGGFLINDVPQFRADQMPYGGVKMSGTGREGPHYAMEEMTERKLIVWRV
jgi:acyl-CoA reductase-like NAD-dependent aldehyde dehydrogenase